MDISFVGGGVMAEALLKGIVNAGLSNPGELTVSDPLDERRLYLESEYGINTVESNSSIVDRNGIVILAVKPQILPYVLSDLRGKISDARSVASIVAGATSMTIREGLSHNAVVRIMPNTPAQIGQGMSVWYSTGDVADLDRSFIGKMLRTLGDEVYVEDEKFVDMATALSASGPAYVFLFIESLVDAGVYLGMSRDMARRLVLQTVLGSTELVKQSGRHPAEVKAMVTSPGGTTIEALVSMEDEGFRALVRKGVRSADERSHELGG